MRCTNGREEIRVQQLHPFVRGAFMHLHLPPHGIQHISLRDLDLFDRIENFARHVVDILVSIVIFAVEGLLDDLAKRTISLRGRT